MAVSRAQRAKTADRRAKAVAMRTAGVDWQTIADRLGYSSRGAACKDVTRALEVSQEEATRNTAMHRHLELLRLDRLQAGLWTTAAGGDPKAVTAALGIVDRRIKLLGIDAGTLERNDADTVEARREVIARVGAQMYAVLAQVLNGLGLSADQRSAVPRLVEAAMASLVGSERTLEGTVVEDAA